MNWIYETKMKEEEQRKRGGRKGREGGKKRNVRIKKMKSGASNLQP